MSPVECGAQGAGNELSALLLPPACGDFTTRPRPDVGRVELTMIRTCSAADVPGILEIVNDAARAYRGVIPNDLWHDPYMDRAHLESEIAAGVDFRGWDEAGELLGVMGIQQVLDATLIRHAYVRSNRQAAGIGGALLEHLAKHASGRLLVGTWAAAYWAIRFYERHGFGLVAQPEKDRLLDTYWTIPARQRDTSVVLVRDAS
jgi:GNAT superfamily N-acetyltransferase